MISEKLVTLPDRLVAVVGTDHGEETFPGQEQTEIELRNYFGVEGPHAIVFDSLPRLEENQEPVSNSLLQISQDMPIFLTWALQYSASRGIYLIGADPASISQEFERVIFNEEVTSMLRNIGISITYNFPLEKVIYESAWIVGLFGLGQLVGAGIETRLKRFPTRREFLTNCLVGIPGMAIVLAAGQNFFGTLQPLIDALTSPMEGGVTAVWTDEFGRPIPVNIGSEDDIKSGQNMRLEDRKKVDELFFQTRELGSEDYGSDFFQRVSGENYRNLVYAITFRNAVMAEAIVQPTSILAPNADLSAARLAAVVGGDHLVIPTESRISWFLTHDEARGRIITELTKALFVGLQETSVGIDLDNLKRGLSNLGRRYLIDPETAKLETHIFPIPALEKALELV